MSVSRLSILLFLLLPACATTVKEKIVRNTLIATAAGAIYGSTKQDFKPQHELMYGATAGLIASLASLYVYDPDEEVQKVRQTTNKLRDELDDFENGYSRHNTVADAQRFSGSAVTGLEKLPEQYRRMINPGQWSLSEIDQWVDGGEGRMIHQDKLLELKPATLKPR